RVGLAERGYRVQVFDRLRGPVVNLLRRPYLGARHSSLGLAMARRIRWLQARMERNLIHAGLLRPSWDDILDVRTRLAARFRGSHASLHQAAIPHPRKPEAIEPDFQRINYQGATNIIERARDAVVPKIDAARSAQVYR